MQRLGVDRIDLWQLHGIDPKVPRADQFDAIRGFISEGLIRYAPPGRPMLVSAGPFSGMSQSTDLPSPPSTAQLF
jgi:hypothetical protein